MKALIIGGTGVISYDVSLLAVQRGIETFILNRGNRPHRMPAGASLIVADKFNRGEVLTKTKNMFFDVAVDFLSYTPAQLERTFALFANKCKHFVFISSATVYGDKTPGILITEDNILSNPVWDYAQNKILCEQLLRKRCEKIKLPYTIVRPYVTYGDTRIPFAVIAKRNHWSLISRILRRKPVVMWDDGNARCTLTHSFDFAKGLVGMFDNRMALNTAVHITSDETFTWNEVLSIISDAIGMKPVVVNIPSVYIENEIPEMTHELLCDKATNMVFSNTKIKTIVPDYRCEIPFREGIKRTIAFYQNNPDMMTVDYGWDARMDRLIYRHCCRHSPDALETLSLSNAATYSQTLREKAAYFGERYAVGSFLQRVLYRGPKVMISRLKRLISRMVSGGSKAL